MTSTISWDHILLRDIHASSKWSMESGITVNVGFLFPIISRAVFSLVDTICMIHKCKYIFFFPNRLAVSSCPGLPSNRRRRESGLTHVQPQVEKEPGLSQGDRHEPGQHGPGLPRSQRLPGPAAGWWAGQQHSDWGTEDHGRLRSIRESDPCQMCNLYADVVLLHSIAEVWGYLWKATEFPGKSTSELHKLKNPWLSHELSY